MNNRIIADISRSQKRGRLLVACLLLLAAVSVAANEGQSGTATPYLSAIDPTPVPASSRAQRIILQGKGFVAGSRAAISRDGKVELLAPERIEVLDSQRVALSIVPGEQRSDWAVQLSTPDNRHSNVLRFQVIPQVEDPHKAKTEAVTAAKDRGVATEPVAESGEGGAERNGARQRLRGYDWLAAQEKSHFTLQLLASDSRERVKWAAAQQHGEEVLALFAMEREGRTLYALTQGSYASRSAAERAAAALPADSSPWIRSMESVHRVMQREQHRDTSVKSVAEPLIEDTAWVWSRNPAHYTLQLGASANEHAMETSMQRYSLPGTMGVLHTRRNNSDWFVLIYGSYSSREAAQQAIQHLPAELRQSRPWVRRFEKLHDLLSTAEPLR